MTNLRAQQAGQLLPKFSERSTRVPHRRWFIASLLGFGVLVNYLDRVNVSVSQDALHAAFGLTTVQFGFLLSAYNWTYCALQIPSGFLLDRFGVTKIGRIGTFIWSIACFCSAGAIGIPSMFASRFLLGVGEAPTFPACAKAIGYWFPRSERSLATAAFDSAAKMGPALGVPLMGILLLRYGWRWSFAATGIVSFLYFLAFFAFYRNPSEDRHLSATERQFIIRGDAHIEGSAQVRQKIPFAHMLRQKKVIGLLLGYGSYNYTFYLLLTWLPSYLSKSLGIDLRQSVLYTSVPWAVGAVVELIIGGWLVNALIHRGWDASRVRQTVLIAGTSLGLGIVGGARAHTPASAVIWISISMAGLSAAAPVGWSIPALIAPEHGVGTLGGILNTCNQMAAILAPIVTGYIAARTHSFAPAFATAAAILVLGIAAYIVLLGRIEPIPEAD
jgi:MFS transporter, ACS family, D-galactonate transporter